MLESLNIENIAVIEQASLEFDPGLNILTGETGAGKSIIIDSINAILGERTTRELVRSGASSGTVSAFFTNISNEVAAKLSEYDLPIGGDNTLLVSRKISADGKTGSCKINGRSVTVSILKELGRSLINIHGQHDSQALLNPEQHYSFIDMMSAHPEFYNDYFVSFRSLIETRRKLKALSTNEEEKARRLELLDYQINEIEEADMHPGEKEELSKRRNLIVNSESVAQSLHNALECLNGGDEYEGALSAFSHACNELETAAKFSPDLSELLQKMYDTLYLAESYKDTLREKEEEIDFNPSELEALEQRLDLLHRLFTKYGTDEKAVLTYLEKAKSERESIHSADIEFDKLTSAYNNLLKETVSLADRLSSQRKATAASFEKEVKRELEFLDMPGIQFKVQFEKGKLSHLGYDVITFLIATNPGEPLKGLNKIASGGELSRIMLAMKNILARNDSIGTLIFDEIDTGVSGSASQKIGRKLKSVSRDCQVLCVTHSAQIASFADRHLFISKQVRQNRTYTDVKALTLKERPAELARIMGGDNVSETLLKSAKEMLKNNLEDK